jgi:hypothetical protein
MSELIDDLEKVLIKKKLGQFYTTNAKYILQNMTIPDSIIEPFTGNGDLVQYALDLNKDTKLELYDLDPKYKNTIKRDTLATPPNFKDKFVLTNPPYLALNKSQSKEIYKKYKVNDLYKCFIKELITNIPQGGILIIPMNFWLSIRANDCLLRKRFLEVFQISNMNVFEERVFNDTSYAICCFQFIKQSGTNEIPMTFYPSKNKLILKLNKQNNYIFGGEMYKLKQSEYKINRITSKNKNSEFGTKIKVKCLDNNEHKLLGLSIVNDDEVEKYIDNTPKLSARSYAILSIEPKLNDDDQKTLVIKFNAFMKEQRKKYNSLFLTNYRESKNIARKRISFKLVYGIVSYLLNDLNQV